MDFYNEYIMNRELNRLQYFVYQPCARRTAANLLGTDLIKLSIFSYGIAHHASLTQFTK